MRVSLWLLAPTSGLAVRSEVQEVQVEVASTAGFQVRQEGQAAAVSAAVAAATPQFNRHTPPIWSDVKLLSRVKTMGICTSPVDCTVETQCACSGSVEAGVEGNIMRLAERHTINVKKGVNKQRIALKVKLDGYKPLWIGEEEWSSIAEIFSGPFWTSWAAHARATTAHTLGNLLTGMRVIQRHTRTVGSSYDVDVVKAAFPGWAELDPDTHLIGVAKRVRSFGFKSLPSGATSTTVYDQDFKVTFECGKGADAVPHTHISFFHMFSHFTSDDEKTHVAYDSGKHVAQELPKTIFGGGSHTCPELYLTIEQTLWHKGKPGERLAAGKYILGHGKATDVRLPEDAHSVAFEFKQMCTADPKWTPTANDFQTNPFCNEGKHGLFIWDVKDSTGDLTATTTRSIFYLENPMNLD